MTHIAGRGEYSLFSTVHPQIELGPRFFHWQLVSTLTELGDPWLHPWSYTFHLLGVLGILSLYIMLGPYGIWAANDEIHYVQGMLERYISGPCIQVD